MWMRAGGPWQRLRCCRCLVIYRTHAHKHTIPVLVLIFPEETQEAVMCQPVVFIFLHILLWELHNPGFVLSTQALMAFCIVVLKFVLQTQVDTSHFFYFQSVWSSSFLLQIRSFCLKLAQQCILEVVCSKAAPDYFHYRLNCELFSQRSLCNGKKMLLSVSQSPRGIKMLTFWFFRKLLNLIHQLSKQLVISLIVEN